MDEAVHWTPEYHYHLCKAPRREFCEECCACCRSRLPTEMWSKPSSCTLCTYLTPDVESMFRSIATLLPPPSQAPNNMVYLGLKSIKKGGQPMFPPSTLVRIASFHSDDSQMRTGTVIIKLLHLIRNTCYEATPDSELEYEFGLGVEFTDDGAVARTAEDIYSRCFRQTACSLCFESSGATDRLLFPPDALQLR